MDASLVVISSSSSSSLQQQQQQHQQQQALVDLLQESSSLSSSSLWHNHHHNQLHHLLLQYNNDRPLSLTCINDILNDIDLNNDNILKKESINIRSFLYLSDNVPHFDAEVLADAISAGAKGEAAYSTVWSANMRKREEELLKKYLKDFTKLPQEVILLRKDVVQNYWNIAINYGISAATIHLAIWIFDLLIMHDFSSQLLLSTTTNNRNVHNISNNRNSVTGGSTGGSTGGGGGGGSTSQMISTVISSTSNKIAAFTGRQSTTSTSTSSTTLSGGKSSSSSSLASCKMVDYTSTTNNNSKAKIVNISEARCGSIAAVSFRMASKFDERPEALWPLPNIWKLLPRFELTKLIDRSEASLNKLECECCKVACEALDFPLRTQFFHKYLSVGGWPKDMCEIYSALGTYLLALSTFSSDMMISSSKLAAAAVVLSVKIVNGDGHQQYEYFPQRLSVFSEYDLKDLKPTIKALSALLRAKPPQTDVLGRLFPEWGVHEWQ